MAAITFKDVSQELQINVRVAAWSLTRMEYIRKQISPS